jgi:ribA/ribD-fused uncharacterized protein
MTNMNEKFFENENGVYFKSNWPSQWYISDFIIDGITYNCCEKRMMHQKAIKFGDFETASLILNENEPSEHKKLGRLVKNFCKDEWDKIADDVVFNANLAKFSENVILKKLLLDTGDKIIVECSPYDDIWGNGLNITDTLKTPMENWRGTNRLGKVLMRVRDVLKM